MNCPLAAKPTYPHVPLMTPSWPRVPRNVEMAALPSDVVGVMCHCHWIDDPMTDPTMGPTLLGPLHVPEMLLPLCRKAHTGAMLRSPSVPLTAHVPAKFVASAAAGETAMTAIAALVTARTILLNTMAERLQQSGCLPFLRGDRCLPRLVIGPRPAGNAPASRTFSKDDRPDGARHRDYFSMMS